MPGPAVGLVSRIGVAGVFAAAVIAAVLLGVVVSTLFGTEIKTSPLIGGAFMLAHLAVGFLFSFLLQ